MTRLVPIAFATIALTLAACAAPAPASTVAPTTIATALPTRAPTAAPATLPPQTPTPEPAITPSPTPVATPQPTPVATTFPEGSVIVTFSVGEEQFKVLLTDPADVAIAEALLAGEEAPPIPNGLIIYGDPGVNAPWNWQLDPDSVEFADVTIEVCDGLPSHVQDRILTSERFCPWSAQVLAVEPAD